MYANNIQSPRGRPISVLGRPTSGDRQGYPRASSLTRDQGSGAAEIHARMKHTVDYKSKGFKPNTRGDFIQGSFATLEELLTEVPVSIGFNAEISMWQAGNEVFVTRLTADRKSTHVYTKQSTWAWHPSLSRSTHSSTQRWARSSASIADAIVPE